MSRCPSVELQALGELQQLPHAHLLNRGGIADVLGDVGELREAAPQVVARQDIDLGRLRAIPVPVHGAPLSPLASIIIQCFTKLRHG
jgi:hypothetical protein